MLFWNQAQRDANFPHMEELFPGHVVQGGRAGAAAAEGHAADDRRAEVDAFMERTNTAGLIVVQDGKVGWSAMRAG